MRTHTRGDKRKCALEMMAEKEVEEKEEGVHVQGGRYFGIGSYVSTYHASIQTLFIRCSAVLSFLLNVAASSVSTAAIQRRPHNRASSYHRLTP